MAEFEKNIPLSIGEIRNFMSNIDLPLEMFKFYEESDGGSFYGKDLFVRIWSLKELSKRNDDYKIDDFFEGYYLFGDNGGDGGFAIHLVSKKIYEIPFVSISKDEVFLIENSFSEFIDYCRES